MWRDGKLWTQERELLAAAIERSDEWSNVVAQAWGAKPRDLPGVTKFSHPDRQTAPERQQRTEPTNDPAKVAEFFSRFRSRK